MAVVRIGEKQIIAVRRSNIASASLESPSWTQSGTWRITMSTADILAELQSYGSEQTKKTLMNHGAREPFFGVKVADLKKIQKRIKKDYQLALDLYATGNSDAMYLAGLIADDEKMTKKDLQRWAEGAYWYMLA